MSRIHTCISCVIVIILLICTAVRAEGLAGFSDGRVMRQGGAAFLCMPGDPHNAQDQTSGIVKVGNELYSIGDDSGQVFRFTLDPPYMKRYEPMRVPLWRSNLDLEDITLIPQTGELVASLESRDTRVRIMRMAGGALELDRDFYLELPPGYEQRTNIGPEGLAFDAENGILIVGWEGLPLFRGLGRYLSFYRMNCGQSSVTSVQFLRHVKLPGYIQSVCGLYYDAELEVLLIMDRNADTLRVMPDFSTQRIVTYKSLHYDWPRTVDIKFTGIRDGFGREYYNYSFEGVTVTDEGRLYLVTDPWRSEDYSTYHPLDEKQMDDYYRLYVPQAIWFDGFREELSMSLANYR